MYFLSINAVFPSVLWHCWLCDRKGHLACIKLGVVLLLKIWLELCTSFIAPDDTITSNISFKNSNNQRFFCGRPFQGTASPGVISGNRTVKQKWKVIVVMVVFVKNFGRTQPHLEWRYPENGFIKLKPKAVVAMLGWWWWWWWWWWWCWWWCRSVFLTISKPNNFVLQK